MYTVSTMYTVIYFRKQIKILYAVYRQNSKYAGKGGFYLLPILPSKHVKPKGGIVFYFRKHNFLAIASWHRDLTQVRGKH